MIRRITTKTLTPIRGAENHFRHSPKIPTNRKTSVVSQGECDMKNLQSQTNRSRTKLTAERIMTGRIMTEPRNAGSAAAHLNIFNIRELCKVVTLMLLACSLIFAQNVQYPENTVDKSFRSAARIDPVTLGMNFEIPLGTYVGRNGTTVPINMVYSSKLWKMDYQSFYQEINGGVPTGVEYSIVAASYAEDSGAGWRGSFQFPSFVQTTVDYYDNNGDPSEAVFYQSYRPRRIRMKMPAGESVEFREDDKVHVLQPNSPPNYPLTYYSTDGSKLKFVQTANETGTLYLPDGSQYIWGTATREYIDRQGNKLTYNTSNQWIDTLGRTIDTPQFYNRSVPANETYTQPGINGGTSSSIFRWKYLKDPQTQETVLSNPAEALHDIGDYPETPTPNSRLFGGVAGSKISPANLFNPVVLAEVELPNGSKYQFTYNVYGEIDKIIYPTGGYERFEYNSVGNISPLNAPYDQANRGVTKRWISPSGAGGDEQLWQYSSSSANGIYSISTTAPDGTRSERLLKGGREPGVLKYGFEDALAGKILEERVYSSSNQLLRRTLNDYIVEGPRGIGAEPSANRDARLKKTISIVFEPNSTDALVTLAESEYDSDSDLEFFAYLNVKQAKEYHYVAVPNSTAETADINTLAGYFSSQNPARTTETDYLYDANYKARNILTLPTVTKVKDAAGNIVVQSQVEYDEAAYGILSVGTDAMWVDPNTTLRGNVTTSRMWTDVANNQFVETHAQFDNFGNARKAWDAKGNVSEVEFSSTYKFAYPTKTTSAIPDPSGQNGSNTAFETMSVYDFNTGLVTSTTDANGQTSSLEYNDPLLRPTKVIPPSGGAETVMEYTDTPNAIKVTTKTQIDGTNWAESSVYADGLGRTIKTEKKDDAGNVFTETEYDSMSRVKRVTNPYRTGENILWTENTYDDLSRVIKIKTPDNAEVNTTFELAASGTLGTSVTVTDQASKQRRSITNALGQLIRVDEPDEAGNLGTVTSPNQPTSYAYDTLNNLSVVVQGVQTRTFQYDSLSRLKQAVNPESGTILYAYDNNGNLTGKTDARSVTTSYSYDNLNRVLSRTYSDGTPNVAYTYDDANIAYSKGRLTKVSSSISETNYNSFDNLGRVLTSQQITDGQTYNFGYAYNLAGMLVEATYPSGRKVKNTFQTDGDLAKVETQNSGGSYQARADNFSYTAAGAVSAMMLGNAKWENAQFNSRLQPIQLGLGSSQNVQDLWKVNYDYGTTNNNGNVLSQTITVPSINPLVQNYTYDSLNRIKSGTETQNASETWKQTFTYDRYGNRNFDAANTTTLGSCSTAECNPSIDTANNRFTTNQGYTYDLAGNLLTDAQNRSFVYDAENKQTEVKDASNVSIGQYFYDGDGKRVKKVSASETTLFAYDASGKLAAEYLLTASTPQTATTSYLTSDTLGSPRVITDNAGNVTSRRDFMPFGEEISGLGNRTSTIGYQTDSTRQKFTGYERDNETDLDFAQARFYNSKLGRFNSADDPLIGQDEQDPQTWNLYSYTSNNPLNRVDPDGHRWFYRLDTEGRTLNLIWVNPNEDGSYTAPEGDGWQAYIPPSGGGRMFLGGDRFNAFYIGEDENGAPITGTLASGGTLPSDEDLIGGAFFARSVGRVLTKIGQEALGSWLTSTFAKETLKRLTTQELRSEGEKAFVAYLQSLPRSQLNKLYDSKILRKIFIEQSFQGGGKGLATTEKALQMAKNGTLKIPESLTRRELLIAKEVATKSSMIGKNSDRVQHVRIELINELLKKVKN